MARPQPPHPSIDGDPSDILPGKARGGWTTRTWAFLIVMSLLPVGLLAGFSYRLASNSVRNLVQSNNLSSATIAAELVGQDMGRSASVARAFTDVPGLDEAVVKHDEQAVRFRLRAVVEAYPRVERAFVTDPEGLEWSDYPTAPESLGKNFSYRDWYKGVSSSWQPYVSEVYRRSTPPNYPIVAVAAPVRDSSSRVVGILVCQCRLDDLATLLRPIRVGGTGRVVVIDHTGTIVAHPALDLRSEEHEEWANLAQVKSALAGEQVKGEYLDPESGRRMVAAFVPAAVGSHRWAVIAEQPINDAYAPVRQLAFNITLAGAIVAIGAVALVLTLGRVGDRNRRLSGELERRNGQLEKLATDLEQTAAAERSARVEAQQAHEKLQSAHEQLSHAHDKLGQAQSQLVQSEKLAALGQLVAGVAHEVNNPLAFVTNNVVVLQRDTEEVCGLLRLYQSADSCLAEREPALLEQVREAADRIDLEYTLENLPAVLARSRDGLKRIQQIVKDLRDFARQEAVGDRQEGADLNSGIESTMNIARGRARKQQVELVTHLQPLPGVTCSPAKINQVILNLVMNAIDACGEGGTVTVTTRPAGEGIEVCVADTGTGIDPAVRKKIFDPFFTTKPQGQGTGLGLSISHGIITEHGGRIDVESEPGKGATFTVYLPLNPPPPRPGAAAFSAPAVASAGTPSVVGASPT